MNPSPWGGFIEGIAGGAKGGMDSYLKGVMAKIDEQQKASIARASMNQDMFSNKNLPLKIRKQAWSNWQKENTDWDTGIKVTDFPDDLWEDNRLNDYFKRAIKIRDNKDYNIDDQIRFTQELIGEATSVLGQSAGAALKPVLSGMETEAFKLGTTGLSKGKLTPENIGLLSGSKAGRGMLAAQVRPVKPKTPAIPLYEKKEIGNGKTQKMKWNPETKKHDIPFGEPVQGEKASYHRIGSVMYEFKGGKSKVMQKGGIEYQATANAMREREWQYSDEAEQYELIQKHKRYLQGVVNPNPAPPKAAMPEPDSTRKGLIGDILDKVFPKHAEELKFGAMGPAKNALLADKPKPVAHKIKRPLTKELAIGFLRAAKGDKELARKLAKQQGYKF